jgi:hypothetical protein
MTGKILLRDGDFLCKRVPALPCAGEDLGEVNDRSRRILGDLLAATEAIGDDESFGRGTADGRQQHPFGESLRYGKLLLLKTEGASHAATS